MPHGMEILDCTVVESSDMLRSVADRAFIVTCSCGWNTTEGSLAFAQMRRQEHRQATDVAHNIALHEARQVESDFMAATKPVWTVTCSCGWTTTRQIRSAALNQADKHRKEQS